MCLVCKYVAMLGGAVNRVGFDDAKKNLLDNGYHHQKGGGECECMYTGFL